jgi:hypothetical protein
MTVNVVPVFSVKRNASQLAGAPGAVRRESFFRMRIKLAGVLVPLNGGIELRGIKGLEPCAKPRQLARGKLFDGFFDVFGGGHVRDIAFAPGWEKGVGQGSERSARRQLHRGHSALPRCRRLSFTAEFWAAIERHLPKNRLGARRATACGI